MPSKKAKKPSTKAPKASKKDSSKKVDKTKVKKESTKKVKEVTIKKIRFSKATPSAPYQPSTGSRFKFGTAGQAALEVVVENAGKMNEKEIKKLLDDSKPENGTQYKHKLNAGYFPYVIASHPEHFNVYTDGKVEVTKKFAPDKKAVAEQERLEQERVERKNSKKPKAKKEKAKKEDKSEKAKKSSKKPGKPKTKKAKA